MTTVRWLRLTILLCPAITFGCQSLLRLHPSDPAAQRWDHVRGRVKFRLARQQYHAGQFAEAVKTISESLVEDPSQTDAYVLLAESNLELGKPASAEAALQRAVAAGLQSADLTYMQGVVHELRGQKEEALTAYRRARQSDPREVDFLVAEAECLVVLNRPKEALQLLDANLDVLDDDGSVAALAAHVAALLGDSDAAIKRYRQALALDAVRAAAGASSEFPMSSRASHASPAGAARRSFAGFTSLVSPRSNGSEVPIRARETVIDPDYRLVAEEMGRLLAAAGRCEEALAVLGPLLNRGDQVGEIPGRNPEAAEDGVVRAAVATCHLQMGDTGLAKQTIDPYAAAHPEDAHAQLLLAKAAIGENDFITALRALRLAEQQGADVPEVWLVRAAINWKRGRLGVAAADLYDVLQNRPEDTEAHCLLAEVLRAQEHAEAARTHFQRALEIDADCTWAAAGLKALADASPPVPVDADAKLTSAQDADLPSSGNR